MPDLITTAVNALLKVGGGPALTAAQRNDRVQALLKRLKLAGQVPADFGTIYARAMVEHCFGEPESVVKLFRDGTVRETFLASYRSGDWEPARRVIRETVDRNAETGEFGHLPYRSAEQLDGFVAVFQRLVELSRTPAQADAAHRIHALPERVVDELRRAVPELADELVRVASTRVDEEAHRQGREPARSAATPLQRLAADVRDWFATLDYRIVRELDGDDRHFAWIIRAPIMPGRYGEVLVVGVDGELMGRHVDQARQLMTREAVGSAWLVAKQRISPAARKRARADGPVFCWTFDDLIDLAADFEPYLDWLDAEVARLDMERRYVPLSCVKEEPTEEGEPAGEPSRYDWRDGGLAEYVHRWLADPAKEHLSVLGEFGTGKSWFSLHFAWEVGKLWREAKRRGLSRPRLPLVIPLRSYAKAADVTAMISQFFFADHRIELRSYRVFEHLNRMGWLLLIFDGFDEMAARVDRHTMANNFAELIKVVEPGAKVLLSSRTEHFPDATETRRLFDGETARPATGEPLRFDVVEIAPLDDEQIEKMLRGRTDDAGVIRLVTEDRRLRDLLRRPVMSDLVLEAVPEIRAGDRIDLARVYLYAVRRKLDRDIQDGRTFTSRADKLYFLCELAWEMLSTNTLSMNYRDFPDRLHTYFGTALASAKDRDHWDHDMRAQTLLVRNADGDYSPAHKSLLEFFVALKFAAELGILAGDFLDLFQDERSTATDGGEYVWSEYFAQERQNGVLPPLRRFAAEQMDRLGRSFGAGDVLSPTFGTAVLDFLRPMIQSCPEADDRLLAIARASGAVAPGTAGCVGGNCLTALLYAGVRREFEVNLAGADLTGLNPNHDLTVRSLAGADLRKADLRRVNLSGLDLRHADLTGARISGEEIVRSSRLPRRLGVLPDGTVLITSNVEVLVWPSGDLGAPSVRWPLPRDQQFYSSQETGPVARDDHSVFLDEAVLDVRTGQWRSAPWRALLAIRWQGGPAVLAHQGVGAPLAVVDPISMRVTSEVENPAPREPARSYRFPYTYSPDLGVCRVSVLPERPGELEVRWLDEKRGWRDAVLVPLPDSIPVEGGLWAGGGSGQVWIFHGELPVALFDPSGQLLWETSIDRQPGLILDKYPKPAALHDARRRQVVVGDDKGITAMPTPNDRPLWSVTVPLGVGRLVAHPDGETFLSASPSGEIAHRRLDTGAVISRCSVNDSVKGARISRTCGLSEPVLDGLALAGAIILDD